MSDILRRIEREVGIEGLAEILAERLGPSDLQSLMLEVYSRRSDRRSPADLLSDYLENRFVRPSATAPERHRRLPYARPPSGGES